MYFKIGEAVDIIIQVLQCLAFLGIVRPSRSNGSKIDGTTLMVPDGTMVPLYYGIGTKINISNLLTEIIKHGRAFERSNYLISVHKS
jgi:hypothetical protein